MPTFWVYRELKRPGYHAEYSIIALVTAGMLLTSFWVKIILWGSFQHNILANFNRKFLPNKE